MIFRSVKVAEWPPFWRELLSWFTICSLYFDIVILVIFHFGFVILVIPTLVSRAGLWF